MQNILLIEDEKKMREFIKFFLEKESYKVVEAENGQEGVDKFSKEDFQLVIMDLMMPVMGGFEACAKIRETSEVPVIMLTAVDREYEHIKGYNVGVDAYVTKPFKINVLLAKVKRILGKSLVSHEMIHSLQLNRYSREIHVEGNLIKMTPKEYDLLLYMVDNKGIALSREQMLTEIWGYDFEGGIRVVDNHIKKLRGKLLGFSTFIKTVSGFGYKVEV